MKSLALRSVMSVFFLSGTFLPPSGFAAEAWQPTPKKKTYRVKKKSAELARASTPIGSPSLTANVPSAAESKPATSLPITPSTVRIGEPSKRILNIRLHPITLLEMATRQDTRVSLRGDLDFVLSDKMTLGASVIYHLTSNQDLTALQNSVGQSVDLGVLEVGLLSNIYLTGTTSAGGFLFRPHLYWIDAHGEKNDGSGTITPSSHASKGGRAGAEMIYQVILTNGFNLEIGGGFTYHLVPYKVDFSDGGQAQSTPDNRMVPTLSAGIGWAF